MRLDGKTAVVTGGASGIGRATAEAFALAGARVALGDINEEGGDAVAGSICVRGGVADYIRLDVTDPASVEAFRNEALEKFGRVDIVANVAGWGRTEPFVQNTPEFWKKLIDLNLVGTILVTRAFLDPMIERRSGKIVSISSDAGRVGSTGEAVYAGAKAGIVGNSAPSCSATNSRPSMMCASPMRLVTTSCVGGVRASHRPRRWRSVSGLPVGV